MKKLCYRIVDAFSEDNNDPWHPVSDLNLEARVLPHLNNEFVRTFPKGASIINANLHSAQSPTTDATILIKGVDLSSLYCPNFSANKAFAIDFALEGALPPCIFRVQIKI